LRRSLSDETRTRNDAVIGRIFATDTPHGDTPTLAGGRHTAGRQPAYEINATIETLFSQGILWRTVLISYDTPARQSATGTTSSFAIPTRFRGDQPATVKAKHADGDNAGPANWTSFKEFHATTRPTAPPARPR
jgi:endoglucanase